MKRLLYILLLVPSLARASENQLEFNLGRGTPESFVAAGGSSDHVGSRGTQWSADFLHQATPGVYVGLGGGQFRSNDNVSQTFIANENSTLLSRTSHILLLTRVDLSRSQMVPYILAGVGWARNSLMIAADPGLGTIMQDHQDTLAYASAIGLDYALNDRLFIGVEARYQSSLKREFHFTPAGQAVTGANTVETAMTAVLLGVKVGVKY